MSVIKEKERKRSTNSCVGFGSRSAERKKERVRDWQAKCVAHVTGIATEHWFATPARSWR